MTLLELLGRDKAMDIRKHAKRRSKQMNPKSDAKQQKMSSYSTRPEDPSSGLGGEDHGTGLMS